MTLAQLGTTIAVSYFIFTAFLVSYVVWDAWRK